MGRRPRARRCDGLRAVRRGVRQLAGYRRRNRLDHPPGDGQAGFPAALRRRRHHHVRRARHPDPPVDRDGDVRGRDQHVGRRAVHRRDRPRHRAGNVSGHDDVVAGAQEQLPAAAQGGVGATLGDLPREHLGAPARDRRHRGYLHRHLHSDRGRGNERRLRVLRRGVRLQGHDDQESAEDPARFGEHERDAALHHHQRGHVQLPDDLRTDPAGARGVDARQGPGCGRVPAVRQRRAAARGQCDGALVDRADHGADPLPGRDEARHRPDPLRHHDGGQHGGRHVPPAGGPNLYVASGITKMGITELTIAVWPWLLTMLVFLVIVTYWPPLTLVLPRALGML